MHIYRGINLVLAKYCMLRQSMACYGPQFALLKFQVCVWTEEVLFRPCCAVGMYYGLLFCIRQAFNIVTLNGMYVRDRVLGSKKV